MKKITRGLIFHGTRFQNLESILKKGLLRAKKGCLGATQQFSCYHNDGLNKICLTNHFGNGCFYGVASYPLEKVNTDEFIPVVIVIDETKLNKEFLIMRKPNGGGTAYKGSKEFDYLVDIPKEAIIGYWKFNKQAQKYEYNKVDNHAN